MSIKKQSEQQIYGRNDMIMLEQNNKIYGSLGLADRYVMKTEEGTRLILSNPKLGSFDDVLTEFNIYGMSKQVTTTGAQLLNIEPKETTVENGIVYRINYDGTIELSGTATVNTYILVATLDESLDGKTAFLSGAVTDKVFIGITDLEDDGTTVADLGDGASFTFVENGTTKYVGISVDSGTTVNNIIKPMLNLGTTAKPWEKYTGGMPAPNPEYPQEIVSVGENGSIGVEITGKNLFDLSKEYTSTSVVNTFTFTLKPSTKYTLSTDFPATVNVASIYFGGPSSNINGVWKDRPKTFATDSSGNIIVHIRTLEQDNAPAIFNDVLNGVYHIQLEEGNTATSYEPYHEPQSFSISTPTGLPAIPVPSDTSGITYTDTDGQAWIADEIDFARGKYVQRVWKGVFDGSEDEEWKKGGINYIHIECLPVAMSSREGFCSQYIVGNSIRGIRIGNGNVSLIIFDDFSDENALSNFKANLSANPLKVMTYLNTPIERDLAPEEIEAYQSLVTYDRTTIVENDAECYTKITYMAKGN